MKNLARWRLVLGRYAEPGLPRQAGGLQGAHGRMDRALEYLYGREYKGRGLREGAGRRARTARWRPRSPRS